MISRLNSTITEERLAQVWQAWEPDSLAIQPAPQAGEVLSIPLPIDQLDLSTPALRLVLRIQNENLAPEAVLRTCFVRQETFLEIDS